MGNASVAGCWVGVLFLGLALPCAAQPKVPDDLVGAKAIKDDPERLPFTQRALDAIEALSKDHPEPKIRDLLATKLKNLRYALEKGQLRWNTNERVQARGVTIGKGTNPKDKTIVLPDLYTKWPVPQGGHLACNFRFINLVQILIHEADHLPQDPPAMPRGPGANAEAKIKAKVKHLGKETEVRAKDVKFKAFLAGVFERMVSNLRDKLPVLDGLEKVHIAKIFEKCSFIDLNSILRVVTNDLKDLNEWVFQATTFILNSDLTPLDYEDALRNLKIAAGRGMKPAKRPEAVTPEEVEAYLQTVRTHGSWQYKAGKQLFSFTVDSEKGQVAGQVVPGVRYPQDAILVHDSSGWPHLVIVGFSSYFTPSGSITHMPANVNPPEDFITLPRVTDPEFFSNKHHKELASSDPRIPQPTGILRTAGGRFLVWDPSVPGIFELRDTNRDGVPDTLDPTNRLRIAGTGSANPNAGPREGPIAAIRGLGAFSSWRRGTLVASLRIVDMVSHHDWPMLVMEDRDGDGIYETWALVRPSELPSLAPVILGDPLHDVGHVDVGGPPEHRVEIRRRPAGAEGPVTVVGRGAIGADGFGRIPLQGTVKLVPGDRLQVANLTAVTASAPYTVLTDSASVTRLDRYRIATAKDTLVTVFGYRLDRVARVEVAGEAVEIVRRTPTEIVLRVPPKGRSGAFQIVLVAADGSRIASPGAVLRPDYDY